MRRMMVWFFLSVKRWLLHPGFALLLLAMPILLWGISTLEPEETEKIQIGVAAEGDGLGTDLKADLMQMSEEESMFEFVSYSTEEELKRAVQMRQAECGYFFPEDLEKKLDQGRYKRSIFVYTAPSTILEPLAGEVVFSVLAAKYDGMIFADYAESQGEQTQRKEPEEFFRKEAISWYQVYQENGSTFDFEFKTEGLDNSDGQMEDAQADNQIFPVRGLIGVFVFLSSFFAACSMKEDEQRGLFLAVPHGEKALCKLGTLAAPVCLAAISGWMGLWVTGEFQGIVLEIAALSACGTVSIFYAWAASAAVPKAEWIAMLIPALALGLLLVCPIFIDAGKWLDFIGLIRWFLPPAWYLGMF